MGKRVLAQLYCYRCDWVWFPRKAEDPAKCPHCFSVLWNKPRKVQP